MRRALGRFLGRLAARSGRRAAKADPPPLTKGLGRPAREFRCWCGAPSAADEPVLCHSCRAEVERRTELAEVVDLPRPMPLSMKKRARG